MKARDVLVGLFAGSAVKRNRTAVPAAKPSSSAGAKGSGALAHRHPRGGLALLAFACIGATLALGASTATALAPVVTVEDATNPGFTSADVNGSIDPDGQSTTYRFQYISEAQFQDNLTNSLPGFEGARTGIEESTETSGPVAGTLTGLSPDTTYHLRLQAENGDGQSEAVAASTFQTKAVTAPSVSIDPVTTFDATSASFSGDVTPNGTDPTFDTNWHFECTPECPGLKGGSIPADVASHEVSAEAKNLQPNIEYTVKLVASNAGGTTEASEIAGQPVSFKTTATGPSVKAFAAGPIQADQVRINGQINPHNSATEYWFEWGTADCSTSTCQAIPVGKDADAGSGETYVYVSRQLSGLQPEITYHFRLLAKSDAGTTEGEDIEFTTGAAPAACANASAPGAGFLPECRAWEMVSPPDKGGGDVAANTYRTHAAVSGDAVAFQSLVGFGDVKGSGSEVQYLSRRTDQPGTTGWSTHAVTPPEFAGTFLSAANGNVPGYEAFSPDLNRGVFRAWRPLTTVKPEDPFVSNFYLRSGLLAGNGTTELISPSVNPLPAFPPQVFQLSFFTPWFTAASDDFSHILFESRLALTADATFTSESSLYENANGQLRLVGRVPVGSETACDDVLGPPCVAATSSQGGLSGVSLAPAQDASKMISDDGSRVFLQTPANQTQGGTIYMREDGTRTVQLNASEKTSPDSPQVAQIWDVSSDGSRAFFTTGESLVDGDDGNVDLYMYDVDRPAGQRLTLISIDSEPADTDEVQTVIGSSNDGHYVYFISSGQLVAGEPRGIGDGIYLWHDGEISYIGHFNYANAAERGFNQAGGWWAFTNMTKTSRVTPDGRHLLFGVAYNEGFVDRGGFSGFDQGSGCIDDGPCRELFVYSADSGALACASCSSSGGPATADANTVARLGAGGTNLSPKLSHAFSDDGRRVFFSTSDSLLPGDTNGKNDAYMYEVPSGTLHLISSGTSPFDSFFLDASADGDDVFFTTTEQISGWDTDQSFDLYDARVGGGLPEPVPVPAPCVADSCRTQSAAVPAAANPGSVTLQGAPDPRASRCPKGKRSVKALNGKTRCLKKKQPKRKADNNRRAAR